MQMLNFTNNCYLKEENKIHMTKNAIFWIREDFRIEHNPALSFASQNHDNVVGLKAKINFVHFSFMFNRCTLFVFLWN